MSQCIDDLNLLLCIAAEHVKRTREDAQTDKTLPPTDEAVVPVKAEETQAK